MYTCDMARIEAGQNIGFWGRMRGAEAQPQPQLTPVQAWEKAFDAKVKEGNIGQGVLRYNKGDMHISLQEYEGLKVAHLDHGKEHEQRMAVAVNMETGDAHIVRSLPVPGDEVNHPSHIWEVVHATDVQRDKYLNDAASDIAKSKPQNTRKDWKGQRPENALVQAAIQKSQVGR